MSISRRQTLAILGGGFVVAAAGAATDLLIPPANALAPWSTAGSYEDPRMNALSYAVLAPNPHNRQPWMVDLSTPDYVTLYVDRNRLLPHTDPFSRQIVIGLGSFLEILRMAAAEQGLKVEFELFPDGQNVQALDDRRVAVAKFSAGGTPDPLFKHVLQRRSQKEPYDLNRPVTADTLGLLENACENGTSPDSSNDAKLVQTMRDITRETLIIELETPHTYKESVDLFRIGRAEVNANPDGIDFTGPLFQFAHRTGIFSRQAAMDTNSQAYQGGIQYVNDNANSAMAFIWLTTDTNTRVDQINAGRDWVRVNLATTAAGVAMQPMSQPLQEYPEVAKYYELTHNLLAPNGGTVQMLGRLGYCDPVAVSPRWSIEEKILNG